jgi:hypothetical protein
MLKSRRGSARTTTNGVAHGGATPMPTGPPGASCPSAMHDAPIPSIRAGMALPWLIVLLVCTAAADHNGGVQAIAAPADTACAARRRGHVLIGGAPLHTCSTPVRTGLPLNLVYLPRSAHTSASRVLARSSSFARSGAGRPGQAALEYRRHHPPQRASVWNAEFEGGQVRYFPMRAPASR